MPLFYQHNINESTKLGVWQIAEPEDFFLAKVPLQHTITHPHKRLQHLAGRHLLRFLFPGFPNELIRIASTKKPFLADEAFHFSISHCGDFAAAIVSRTNRVGIDIEIPTAKVARIRHKFLHTEEQVIIEKENNGFPAPNAATEDIFLRKLTLLWSAKEAIFKWYGDGEVNFSDQIRVQPLKDVPPIPGKGKMNGLFLKQQTLPLILPFVNFREISLVWVIT